MRYYFKSQQWLPYPVELIFAYFANPHNLPKLMPKWQRLRLEEAMLVPPPPRPVTPSPAHRLYAMAAGNGSQITFSFRPLPLSPARMPWESSITSFEWNHSFADVGVRTPFRYWQHLHLFETETRANANGVLVQGTLVKDMVEYSPPGAGDVIWSRMLQGGFVEPMIKRIFRARQQNLIKLLPAALGKIVPLPPSEGEAQHS